MILLIFNLSGSFSFLLLLTILFSLIILLLLIIFKVLDILTLVILVYYRTKEKGAIKVLRLIEVVVGLIILLLEL